MLSRASCLIVLDLLCQQSSLMLSINVRKLVIGYHQMQSLHDTQMRILDRDSNRLY